MSRPGETKVTVRVEVVVEGGEPRVTTYAGPYHTPAPRPIRPLEITNPTGSDPVSVFSYGGRMCIEADGTAPTSQGSFPGRVWAIVFPSASPTIPLSPPPGSVCTTPSTIDGKWYFTQAQGNPVPGATCAAPSGSGLNNTLAVWYDFGSGVPYSIESRAFFGVCVSGSGSGPLSGLGAPPPPPAVLRATFSGALASLGTVALAYTGVGWLGLTGDCGGALLAFLASGSSYSLLSVGPGVAFVLTNPPDSSGPLDWSASGVARGPCPGAFDVRVTE